MRGSCRTSCTGSVGVLDKPALDPPALMGAWPKGRIDPHWNARPTRNPRYFSPTAIQCKAAAHTGLRSPLVPKQSWQ